MRRTVCLCVYSIVFLAAGSTALLGQTATGALTGLVQDPEGALLATVELTATNVATGFEYRTTTTDTGRYWLTGLPPGAYDVAASRIGIETTAFEDVTLAVGKTLTLDFQVAIAAFEVEGVRVVVVQRLVASTEADVAFSVSQEMIRRLPEESRSFIDLAGLAPGATVGSTAFGASNFGNSVSVGALNSQSLGVLVDGADFTEPAFGDVSGGIPLLAIQEFEVIQTSYSAELGRAASGIINAVTRRGTNQLEFEAFSLLRGRRLNSLGEFEQEKPNFRRLHWGFALGGPIVENRTHYFVAMERKTEENFVTIQTGSAVPGIDGTFESPFTDNLLFARLDHRISDAQEISLRYSGEIGDKVSGIGSAFGTFRLGASAASNISTDMHSVLATHRWSMPGGMLNQARFHVIRRKFGILPVSDSGPTFCYPSACVGSAPEQGFQNYTRVELIDDVSLVATGASGTHRLKFGAQVSWQDNDVGFQSFNNGIFGFDDDAATTPFLALLGEGQFGPQSRNTQLAVFVQDEWNPTASLTLNVGVRYEIDTNGTNQGYVSPLAGQLSFVRTTPRPVDKNNIAPRFGFAWDPASDGRTVLRGGFGIFYDALPAHSLGGGLESSSGDTGSVFVFGPPTLDVAQLLIDNPVDPMHWPNAAELRTPMTRQFSLGVQRALPRGVELRIDGLLIQGRNIPMERSLNTVDPVTGPAYPGFGALFQMLTEGEADAKLLMLNLSKKFDGGWINLGYTLADRQNTSDSWNDFVQGPLDPAVTDFSSLKGRAAWDERHRVVATGGVEYPFGLSLSGKLVYSSGRPYTAVTVDDLNGDGRFGNDRLPGEPRNGRDGPNFLRADLGIAWSFDATESRRLGVQLNVFNVLNRTNFDPASITGIVESPTFGEPVTAFQKRIAEIGVTIR